MPQSRAELILHPIRGRILMVLSRRAMTTRQIAQALPDVSQASAYRHVAILAEAGVLQVVEEVPVRGVVERVYALDEKQAYVAQSELGGASADDYLRYFQAFTDEMTAAFRLYFRQHEQTAREIDPQSDRVSFWGEIVYLTPGERDELIERLQAVTREYQGNGDSDSDKLGQPQRRRTYIGRVVIPEASAGGERDPEPGNHDHSPQLGIHEAESSTEEKQ